MKRLVALLLFLFINLQLMNAQQCGHEPHENYQTYETEEQLRIANSTVSVSENYCINVCFRIVRDDNGANPGIDPAIIPQVMAQLNAKFNSHGITFVQIGTYDYINHTNYNNYTNLTPGTNPINIPNCFNIYFIKNFTGSATLSGIASFGTLRAVIRGSHALLNNTTAHELGHGLNLLHTFQCTTTNTGFDPTCAESPLTTDGCDQKGDRICDTPADYNPFGNNSNNPYGLNSYNPDQNNIMSQWSSTVYFSAGQGVRIKNAINNSYQLQPIRSYQCSQISGNDYVCPYVSDGTLNTTVPIYDFSVPIYGSGNTFTWSIIGNSNLQFVGSNTSNSVQIINTNLSKYLHTATIQVVITTPHGSFTITKNVSTTCFIRRVMGLYDWVSVDYGDMGLIVPIDNHHTFVSYQWEITEDENRTTLNNDKTKPHFVGATVNYPYKYTNTTNQAIINWGNASGSYLITCYGVTENGTEILLNNSYEDVGDPKNNPCFKDTVTTIVAPNPIHNGRINVVVHKPSHTTPCNYKDLDEPQYFNSEIDEINNSVSVFDYNGIEVYRNIFETNVFTIESVHLQSGNNYIVNLYTKEGGFTQQVIIVE